MPLSMKLWQVDGASLTPLAKIVLNSEARLEQLVRNDPSLVGMDVLFIGQ